MSQTSTFRYSFRTAPGMIYSSHGGDPYETESLLAGFTLQELELVIAGADPFVASATFTYAFPAQDGSGSTITVTTTVVAATTLADAADQIAAAFMANPQAAALYTATSDGVDTITLVARSANTSIPAASFVDAWTDAHTATTTQTVAAAAPALSMGLFYVYAASTGFGPGVTTTPRQAPLAALPGASTTVADLRGVIARVVNQTTLSATFQSNLASNPDAYPAGSIFPGMLRGTICAMVDPASPGTMTPGSQIHVVIAAGAYSVIGAVASAADGGNTLRIDNAPAGNILGRVVGPEENLRPFTRSSGRFVPLKVNRTN